MSTNISNVATKLAVDLTSHLEEISLDRYPYLGVSHGVAGELYALLIWCEVSGHQLFSPGLVARLHDLADLGQQIGAGLRFPINAKSKPGFMESWCHGTPGYVHLWSAAYRSLGEPRFLRLVEETARVVSGADPIGQTLCCGDSGRAYALLEAFRLTREPIWLRRAEDLARHAVGQSSTHSELSYSLYKGGLGPGLLALDLEAPAQASMPLFGRDLRIGW